MGSEEIYRNKETRLEKKLNEEMSKTLYGRAMKRVDDAYGASLDARQSNGFG